MSAAPELAVGAAVDHVGRGGLLAFPTETSWGLAADAGSAGAVARLRAFKGRASDRPLSVLISGSRELAAHGDASVVAQRLAAAFWPGPLTLIVGARGASFAPGVARSDGAVGFRCSSHPDAGALAAVAERRGIGPLTATSLNHSGQPDIVRREDASAFCRCDPVAALLAGAECGGAAPSSVLDCSTEPPTLLREGALARPDLERVAGPIARQNPG